MKRLATSLISDTKRFPFKKGTLEFLQDAHKETVTQILVGLIGSTFNGLNAYVLYGCKNSGTGSVYNITAGAVFYLGEIYLVDSAAFTAGGGQVAVLSFITTQYTTNADPVTFTDSTINNVHDIRKILIASGASGSGIKDFSAVTRLDLTKELLEEFLQDQIDAINAGWTSREDLSDVTITGGSGTAATYSKMRYKVMPDKTMHIVGALTASNTTAPTSFSILVPDGKTNAGPSAASVCISLRDGTAPKFAVGQINASTGQISVTLGSGVALTNATTTTIYYSVTFETA